MSLCFKLRYPTCLGTGKQPLVRELHENRRPTEVPDPPIGGSVAVGSITKSPKKSFLEAGGKPAAPKSPPCLREPPLVEGPNYASSSTTMIAPHYISENKSDMRGIKHGWYAVEDDGKLSSGPFSSREECIKRITGPADSEP
jgi:hypothetical protein